MPALREQPFTIGECLSKEFPQFGAARGVAFLSTIGILLGAVLLVVASMILAVMWSVAAPTEIIERKGPITALKRSQELTFRAPLQP